MSLLLDGERRLRLRWRLLIFISGFIAIQIGLGIVATIAFAVYAVVTGSRIGTALPPATEAWAQILFFWPAAILNIGLAWACRRGLDRRSFRSLGLTPPRASVGFAFGLGLALTAVPAVALLAADGYRYLGLSASLQTAFLVPTLALAAFEEELLCRGYLLQNFVDARRPVLGIVVSSLVFWLLHAFNPDVWASPLSSLNLLAAGVVFALAYRVSGDIWFPTALHYAMNLGQGVLFQLPVSGLQLDGLIDVELTGRLPLWLTGGMFGLESSLVLTAAMAALSWAMALRPARTTPAERELPPAPAALTDSDLAGGEGHAGGPRGLDGEDHGQPDEHDRDDRVQ